MAQSAAMAPVGLLVLRLSVAVVLIVHGMHALFGSFAGTGMGPGGLTATTAYFAATGIKPAFLFVLLASILQLAGGFLLIVGAWTRVTAGVLLVFQIVTLAFDSARWGFFLNWTLEAGRGHGVEYALVLSSALLCFVFTGAGDWSFDGLRASRDASRAAGLARIRDRG